MGFSRQEYWSGLPCPSQGDTPDLGIKPKSLMSPALAGGFLTASTTWEAPIILIHTDKDSLLDQTLVRLLSLLPGLSAFCGVKSSFNKNTDNEV